MRAINPPQALLVVSSALAALLLPFVTLAPNRLLSGHGQPLWALLHGAAWLVLLPWPLLVWSLFGARRALGWLGPLASALWLSLLPWLAGGLASTLVTDPDSLARVSPGAGFCLSWGLTGLLLHEQLRALLPAYGLRALLFGAALLPPVWMLQHGTLDGLSLLKEYTNHRQAFDLAGWQHLRLVLYSVLPASVLGALLGVAAHRRRALRTPLFAVLNIIQTIPSIALFGLLIGPLALLGAYFPASGIAGIGLAPALLALTLYSLLPMARGTQAGLEQVPSGVIDAARGMGLTARQIFWRVELPLALPVFLTGLRITTVQAVGLAEVAALIGAGGFGALMFQGLLGSALDLVLLGVLPVVALAIAVDALFKLLIAGLSRHD